jgi:outer membrane protein assembly factor BamE (lipoprotein component of BamABCDE complex)
VKGPPRLLAALVLLAACESFTGATPPPSGPAPDLWGQALFARVGYTPEQVRAAIGEPTGRTVEGSREIWTYVHPDRPGYTSNRTGIVTFVDGRVEDVVMRGTLTP